MESNLHLKKVSDSGTPRGTKRWGALGKCSASREEGKECPVPGEFRRGAQSFRGERKRGVSRDIQGNR